ncbi:hypothetical protein EES44_30400 [Streptomyces sp. ADI96-15]|nr:hypothetical protein EES44_30400 [Streptomyces sp. ADI96-15]
MAQDFYRLADIAVDRRDPDAEPGGKLGVGVTAAQMRQNQEGLAARRHAPPPGADLSTARSQVPGEVAQMATEQIDRR